MSTRSIIARKTDEGFIGTYHHWDGYPSGVGQVVAEGFKKGGWEYLNDVLSHSCQPSSITNAIVVEQCQMGEEKRFSHTPTKQTVGQSSHMSLSMTMKKKLTSCTSIRRKMEKEDMLLSSLD